MTTSVLTFNLAGQVRHQGLSIAGAEVLLFDLFKAEPNDIDFSACRVGSVASGVPG